MADASQNSLFSLLSARYGVSTALQLMSLFGNQGSDAGKGIGATQAAGTGLGGLGYLASNPQLSQLGSILGRAGGLAGAGYGIYDIASNPNLSTSQKIGTSGRVATDLGMSLVPVVGQFYGAARAASLLGQQLEKSGSPQISSLGRSVDYAAEPAGAKGFWDVVQGNKSPRAAFESQGGAEGLTLDAMGPIGIIMRGLGMHLPGLYHEPTTGTKFRREIGSLFDKVPALKGTDLTKYNMPTGGYGTFDPKAVTAAQQLGQLLSALAPTGKKNPSAYALQTENILLNKFGNQSPQILSQLLPLLSPNQPAAKSAPTTATPTPWAAPSGGGLSTMVKSMLAGQRTI